MDERYPLIPVSSLKKSGRAELEQVIDAIVQSAENAGDAQQAESAGMTEAGEQPVTAEAAETV